MKHLWLTAILLCAMPVGMAQRGLLLSELLYQPASGVAEYVELYNASDSAVELGGYHIVRVLHDSLATHYALPSRVVAPHAYVVLTKDAASVAAAYTVRNPSALVECNLPPYPNDGGSVVLSRADSVVVERLDYSPAMHSRLLRDRAGVSLERRSFDRPAGEAANWFSAASTEGYGTPGYANSQSSERLVEEASFALSATLLSPDGDGYGDELEIAYSLASGDLAARAEVYDARGNMVRRLLDGALLGTSGTIVWDGRVHDGTVASRGQYLIMITVYDLGGTQQVLRRTVAVL